MPHMLCFGAGYTARALFHRLLARNWRITGTSRDPATCERLTEIGIDMARFDENHPLTPDRFDRVTHVLISVPPGETGDIVLKLHGEDMARIAPGIAWAGYLSTTGVYGDRDGGWVDENAELAPAGERGARRVAAEQGWLDLHRRAGLPVHIFRLAGIYGPGRNALVSVKEGKAKRIDKPGQVFSRIHVDDIAQVLEASIARPNPGAAYNVCDNEPAPPADVVTYACELLGVEPPAVVPFEDAAKTMSPMALSFYGENKRCRNTRIKEDLGVTLRFPTYREGLQQILYDLTH